MEEKSWFDFRWDKGTFILCKACRPALGTTLRPTEGELEAHFAGINNQGLS